jgi:hypothetical protein
MDNIRWTFDRPRSLDEQLDNSLKTKLLEVSSKAGIVNYLAQRVNQHLRDRARLLQQERPTSFSFHYAFSQPATRQIRSINLCTDNFHTVLMSCPPSLNPTAMGEPSD